jgi:hypothetical protein
LADIVAKVFLGCRTKILRAAEAFCGAVRNVVGIRFGAFSG